MLPPSYMYLTITGDVSFRAAGLIGLIGIPASWDRSHEDEDIAAMSNLALNRLGFGRNDADGAGATKASLSRRDDRR